MTTSVGWEHMAPLDKGLKDNSLTIAFYKCWELQGSGVFCIS